MSTSASFHGVTAIEANSEPNLGMLMLTLTPGHSTIFLHGLDPIYAARLAQAVNQVGQPLPEGVTAVWLENPEELHNTLKKVLGE